MLVVWEYLPSDKQVSIPLSPVSFSCFSSTWWWVHNKEREAKKPQISLTDIQSLIKILQRKILCKLLFKCYTYPLTSERPLLVLTGRQSCRIFADKPQLRGLLEEKKTSSFTVSKTFERKNFLCNLVISPTAIYGCVEFVLRLEVLVIQFATRELLWIGNLFCSQDTFLSVVCIINVKLKHFQVKYFFSNFRE